MDEFTLSSGGFDRASRPKLGARNYQRADEKSAAISCPAARTNANCRLKRPVPMAESLRYLALDELAPGETMRLFLHEIVARHSARRPLYKNLRRRPTIFPAGLAPRIQKSSAASERSRNREEIRSFLRVLLLGSKIIWILYKLLRPLSQPFQDI